MSKYDKMIELNRERSVEKVAAAKAAIQKMTEFSWRRTFRAKSDSNRKACAQFHNCRGACDFLFRRFWNAE